MMMEIGKFNAAAPHPVVTRDERPVLKHVGEEDIWKDVQALYQSQERDIEGAVVWWRPEKFFHDPAAAWRPTPVLMVAEDGDFRLSEVEAGGLHGPPGLSRSRLDPDKKFPLIVLGLLCG